MKLHVALQTSDGKRYDVKNAKVAAQLATHPSAEVAATGTVAGAAVTVDHFQVLRPWGGDGTGTSDHMSVAGNTSGMIITDSRDLAPGAGCTSLSSRKVKCVNATSLLIDAGGGNDLVQVTAKVPATVRGGDGNDQIRTRNSTAGSVDCRSGNDIATIDKTSDTLNACERIRYS